MLFQNEYSSRLTRTFRSFRLLLHVLYGLLIAGLILPRVGKSRGNLIISRWCRGLLCVLNVGIVTHGDMPDKKLGNTMFVANHISWLDIFALNSLRTMRFVAKSDIRSWPVIGWLCEKANTLFTERSRRHGAGRMVEIAADCLRAGDCLCLFPEGTTSDGSELLPFKGSLIQAAIDAKSQLWPVAIRYPDADGSVNKEMAYYGDMSLGQSIKQILAQRSPMIELHFLPPIRAQGQERRSLSRSARQAIADRLSL
jgi:1-acyl-sn-glycerol-3-phosphate acyltransferase